MGVIVFYIMSVQNTGIDPGGDRIPQKTGQSGGKIELWPEFECRICGYDEDIVSWEESAYSDLDDAPAGHYYEGVEPCCCRCGSRVPKEQVGVQRPAEWKQPILFVVSGIPGMGYSYSGVENIFNEYESDPYSFLTASVDELKTIVGIGEAFADKIHTKRATTYPEITPEVDDVLYEFRGLRLVDVSPERIARDLTISFIDVDDLPFDEINSEGRDVLRQTAQILRQNKDVKALRAARTSSEMESMADRIEDRV